MAVLPCEPILDSLLHSRSENVCLNSRNEIRTACQTEMPLSIVGKNKQAHHTHHRSIKQQEFR